MHRSPQRLPTDILPGAKDVGPSGGALFFGVDLPGGAPTRCPEENTRTAERICWNGHGRLGSGVLFDYFNLFDLLYSRKTSAMGVWESKI